MDQQADILIFDSPPCLPVTDPVILAARMSGVVLVLKIGHTRKGAIKQTVELLSRARARILGTVFNQVEAHRKGYYYYRQYRYHGDDYYGEALPSGRQPSDNGRRPESEGESRAVAIVSAPEGDDSKPS
jgi:Mrp family chromosome partitioning ATPase